MVKYFLHYLHVPVFDYLCSYKRYDISTASLHLLSVLITREEYSSFEVAVLQMVPARNWRSLSHARRFVTSAFVEFEYFQIELRNHEWHECDLFSNH